MGNTLRNCVSSPEEDEGSHQNLLRENSDTSTANAANRRQQQLRQPRRASPLQAQSQRYYLTPGMSRRVDELSEDEQVKIAKRLGLIGYLPIRFFTESNLDADKECVICMVEYETGDELRYLPCTHSFHKACIDAWLMRSFTCPNCSQPVDSALVGSFDPLAGAAAAAAAAADDDDGNHPRPDDETEASPHPQGTPEEAPPQGTPEAPSQRQSTPGEAPPQQQGTPVEAPSQHQGTPAEEPPQHQGTPVEEPPQLQGTPVEEPSPPHSN